MDVMRSLLPTPLVRARSLRAAKDTCCNSYSEPGALLCYNDPRAAFAVCQL